MMTIRITARKTIGFLFFIIIIASLCCNLLKKRELKTFRIIDSISEKNVIESPLKNIIQKFNFVEEDITGKWKHIPVLSSQNQEIWGISSSYSILGNHESDTPEGIKLLKEGKEIEYLNSSAKQETGWRWIATAESLDLRKFNGFDKERRGIRINRENSFQFEKLFPDGDVVIDVFIANPNWEDFRPHLLITFNDSLVEELAITSRNWYRIRKKANLGKYLIEMKMDESNDQQQGNGSVILGMVKITTSSDILLLSQPRQQNQEVLEGTYLLQYFTFAPLPEEDIEEVQPDLYYYYSFKNSYILYDSGIKPNPFFIKKKIVFDEYSLNTLVALPKSVFNINVKIPSNAVLEFGYGILNEFRREKATTPIQFQIILKKSSEEKILLSETISWEKDKDIIYKKIDLKPYAGSNVNLSFLTKEAHPEVDGSESPPIVPVWVNPLIYKIPETQEPNIILISLDTVRPDHLGCYGYYRDTSPGIDRLASDGVLFKNTYSTTSWTLPAHVSMLTSLDCLHHQVYFPLQKMDRDTETLADILRTRQFFCAAFTGGGYLSETYGFSKGFDVYQEIKLHGDQAIRLDEAERLAELAYDWIEKNKEKNFFLFLHTYQPHDPYANLSSIGKEFLNDNAQWQQIKMETLFKDKSRFETQFSDDETQNIIDLYDGEIKYTDVVFVQPILDKLRESGLYDKSMIILTSDHGEEFHDHEAWLHDHSIYDEGIKIPLIIKFPDSKFKGLQVENVARITDILPTILHHLNIKTSSEQFDGQSLVPILKGKEKTHRTFVSDLALRDFDLAPSVISMNKNHFKLILNKKIVSPYTERITRDFNGAKIELYDTDLDPAETKNLASNIAYRDLCFELLQRIYEMCERADQEKKYRDEVTLDQSLRERLKALGYIK